MYWPLAKCIGQLLNFVSQSGPPHNSSEFVSRLNVAGPTATAPASVKTIRWKHRTLSPSWLINYRLLNVLITHREASQKCLHLFPCQIQIVKVAVGASCFVTSGVFIDYTVSLLASLLATEHSCNLQLYFLLPPR